jgi:hypothetical protein
MAAEAHRAPRIAPHATSMAALAASPSKTETPLAAAWVSVWSGCGGALIVDAQGGRSCALPYNGSDRLEPPYDSWSDEERRGAMKALLTIVDLGGVDVLASVFGEAA